MTIEESSDNNAVEFDGVRFETILSNPVLSIPVKKANSNGYTSVELGMKITNATSIPLYFSRYTTLIPELLKPDGQIIEWGRASNWVRGLSASDFLLALPGESVTFFPITVLCWIENSNSISVASTVTLTLDSINFPNTYTLGNISTGVNIIKCGCLNINNYYYITLTQPASGPKSASGPSTQPASGPSTEFGWASDSGSFHFCDTKP
ncbi:MAG: hypothetical protein P2A85_15745 [Microcoleus anatoxicus]|uniref:hypothetical protein n=1 Tax=Microcoleus anatoxicus TaxID=2705319 RepID=UPI00366D5DE9